MTVWRMGDNSIYAQTIEIIANIEPSAFYAEHLFCPVLVNENNWIMIQCCWSNSYEGSQSSYKLT